MRTKPYTEIGIRRMRCVRCGEPAHAQWNACADGSYRPICKDCDIKLNKIVLKFMEIEDAEAKMEAYLERWYPAIGAVA